MLRCCFFDEAEFVEGEPLPVQLRFLCSATDLEELDLGFAKTFWPLPDESTDAVRAAVSGLRSLRRVNIRRCALHDRYDPQDDPEDL